MSEKTNLVVFLVAFAATVLTGCALVLMVPGLFDDPATWQWRTFAVLAVLSPAFSLAARRLRPDIPNP